MGWLLGLSELHCSSSYILTQKRAGDPAGPKSIVESPTALRHRTSSLDLPFWLPEA